MGQSSFGFNRVLGLCRKIAQEESFEEDYGLIFRIGALCDLRSIANDQILISAIDSSLKNECSKLSSSILGKLLQTAFLFAALRLT